ncbi:MAG TPA: peptidoglycan recognition family protein [Isosphaeraceae bacterium]|nr:peptidoglycan recognition family protein [Isosphaeraceae bacterium]
MDGESAALTSTKRVRRASLGERLRPFVDDSSANDLVYPNKADRPWKYIVLHHSATASGNYDQIDGEHRKILGFDGCGYHFVIGNGSGSGDGQIEVAQRWTNQKQGVHCRNARTHDVDEYGIGICLVGDFDRQQPTPRQIAAAQALIAYLSQRYTIAQSRVETHAHLAATKTACPGKYFPNETILPVTRDAMSRPPVRTTWKVVRETR